MLASGLTLPAPLPTVGARAQGGSPQRMDEARFEAFYRRTAASLWSYLFRMTGDSAAADDLLQKAFFRFLRADAAFVSDDHARRWMYRTATNLALDYFRETKREQIRDAQALRQDSIATDSRELRHDMMRTFAELKPRERALLWLAHVEEAPHDDISEALGVKSGSVRVLLFRARKKLAELLTKKGLAPEVKR
jgi:RNA polymerase sigma-70 factor, ECF subfamily